jgi:PST family polysaccharide transporter
MSSIRKSLGSGILYTALAKYSGVVISIAIGAVLARLLTPEEFGIVALVTVFVNFFNLLSDFGLGPAVVQNQSLNDNDIHSIFSFSIILGSLLSGLFFLASPLIAGFYDNSELINVSRLLSLAILFYSLQIVPRALIQKALKFKQLGLITVCVQFFSGVIAIILAYADFSYYALVVQSILISGISLVIFYLLKPIRISWRIQFSSIKKVIRFSSFQFMFNFINYFSRNADNILIGKFLGSAQLGYYDKAYRLMMMPIGNLTHVITPVLMPVLSKHQDDKNIVFNSYLKVVKLLATIGFPLSVFLYFSAGDIIHILYGPQWTQSIPIFELLALTVGIQMVLSSTGSIFQTVNRTDLLFVSGFLSAITMVGAICYGIFIGKNLESIGYGLIVAFSINFFQGFFFLVHKALNKSFFSFLKVFSFPLLIAVILSIFLWVFDIIGPNNIGFSFIAKIVISGLTFMGLVMSRKDYRILLKYEFYKLKKGKEHLILRKKG